MYIKDYLTFTPGAPGAERHELFLVTREASRDIARAQAQRGADRVDRFLVIRLTFFRLAADIGRCGELSLRQVKAIVDGIKREIV